MVHQIKFLKLIVLFAIMALFVFLSFTLKGNVETNLLKTILPSDIAASTDIIPIANKSASVIKVVFEADSVQNLDKLRDNFIDSVDKNYFEINKPDVSNLLNQYLSHPANFLSDSTRELLKNEKYDEVYARSLQALYNPTGIQLSAIDKDPYLFVDDFILANSKFYRTVSSSDDKYYDFLSVKIKSKEGLSPDLSNKKIAEIVQLQKSLTNSSSKIYLAGSPVHSYTTSTNSVVSINIICFLSTLLIAIMTYYYFRSIKVLIPIALSIIFGMLAGYVATKLWFDNFQIITMVFSTTLIGIGIDYSYHYCFADKFDKIFIVRERLAIRNVSESFEWRVRQHSAEKNSPVNCFSRGKLVDLRYPPDKSKIRNGGDIMLACSPRSHEVTPRASAAALSRASRRRRTAFLKNLSLSLLTTIVPFALLYLTGIELLKQIAVFTVFGLSAIYALVVFFYPCFDFPKPKQSIKFPQKIYKITLIILMLLSVAGCVRLHFNDSLTALYTPSKKLLNAEKLFNEVSGNFSQNTQFITIKGAAFEEILQREEKVCEKLTQNKIEYLALSKFIPSKSRQAENFALVKKLYVNNPDAYRGILSAGQIANLKKQTFSPVEFNINSYPYLSDFMLNPTTSLILVFTPDNISVDEDFAHVVNLRSDIEKYMQKYREILFAIFPFVFLILVLVVVYALKRNLKLLLPPVLGIFGAAGLTSFILGELNLFSLISLYLVLGFTMDYSIFRAGGSRHVEDAIFISALTTAFSFLMLSTTGFKLLESISLVLFFGILISYITGYLIFNNKND